MVATKLPSGPEIETDREAVYATSPTALIPNRYRVSVSAGDELTRGGSAGTDTTTGDRVFIKWSANAGQIGREAEILAALDHPGIVRLRHSDTAADAGFLVLDFIEGVDLEAFLALRSQGLDSATLRAFLDQLGAAVSAIHEAGFLHRDLKPANVVMRADGEPVIVDFSAAAKLGEIETATSLITDGYAAPEQYLSDDPEGPWTDVYGLGAIAYRALTGRAPPAAPARLTGTAMRSAVEAAPDHPTMLCQAIDRALDLEPEARPQTVAEWQTMATRVPAAKDIGESRPAPLDPHPPTVSVERRPRSAFARSRTEAAPASAPVVRPRRRWGWLVWLVLLAAVIGAAAWYARPLYERYVKTDWLVDPNGGGDALTIADALARAGDDAAILIRTGTYTESLVVDRPVFLMPAAADQVPLIAPESGACLSAQSDRGSISGLQMRAPEAGPAPDPTTDPGASPEPCLVIAGGQLIVEGNLIAGGAGPAIVIQDGATPVVQKNLIEESAGIGIVVAAGAGGTIFQNTISNVAESGIVVRSGATPEIRENRIENSGSVTFTEGAGGTFAQNQIVASRASAIALTTGANPSVVENSIEGAGEAGIFVYDRGAGTIEGNTIVGSSLSGIVVADGGNVRLTGNSIRESAEHGIVVVGDSRAVLQGNIASDNKGHGIAIGWGAEVELEGNELDGNTEPQLLDSR